MNPSNPTFLAKEMTTDILNCEYSIAAADSALSLCFRAFLYGEKTVSEPNFILVILHVVKVQFPEYFLVPFELFQEQQAPSFVHANENVDFLECRVEILNNLIKWYYFIRLVES